MKAKGILRILAVLIVIGAVTFLAIAGIGSEKKLSASNVKLGLDLAGGVSITYETVDEKPSSDALSDTVYKMQKRAENFSTEAQVYPEGTNRITVSIPDVTDADAVLASLGSAGNIYFIYGMSDRGVANIAYGVNPTTGDMQYVLTRSMDEIIADGDLVLDGSDIAGAEANVYQDNLQGTEYIVVLTLNDNGRQKFASATNYSYSYYNATDS
ncbi:MAG: protein translocase subunit SecDF, partial [Lachnospiraceae bacterium]|nr:protein translocase subunit SecDF [Lachnospiraceae bacterium]